MLSASNLSGLFIYLPLMWTIIIQGGDRYTYFKDLKLAERSLVITKGPMSTKCLKGEIKENLLLIIEYH